MDYTPVGLSNARGRRLAAADARPGTRVNTAISRGTPTRTGCPLVPSPRLTWSQDPPSWKSPARCVESRRSPRRPASDASRFSLPAAGARSALCRRRSRCSGTSTHLALRAADVLGVLQYDETEQNWVKEKWGSSEFGSGARRCSGVWSLGAARWHLLSGISRCSRHLRHDRDG